MEHHTPGPWISDSASGLYSRNITSADGTWHVATVLTSRPARGSDKAVSDTEPTQFGAGNLLLIKAAPDLLAALQNIENDAGQIPAHAWKVIQDAIALATGAAA